MAEHSSDDPVSHPVSDSPALGMSTSGATDELDRRIRDAMDDVPLPAGLADRLKVVARRASLDRIESGMNSAVTSAVQTHGPNAETRVVELSMESSDANVDSSADGGPESTGMVRRAAIATVCAAALGGFAWLANRWHQPAEKPWLVGRCQFILSKWEADNPANTRPPGNALTELPVAVRSQLARMSLLGTRELAGLDQQASGTLLRFDAGDGRAVVLLRMSKLPAVRGLTSRFELLPTSSGEWSLAALTIDEETYVLAANCTQQQLLQYIHRAAVT